MRLPGQALGQADLAQQLPQVAIGAEKDVQPALHPIAVGILPRRHLAPGHGALFQQRHPLPLIRQVFGRRQPGQPGPGNHNLHTLAPPRADDRAAVPPPDKLRISCMFAENRWAQVFTPLCYLRYNGLMHPPASSGSFLYTRPAVK